MRVNIRNSKFEELCKSVYRAEECFTRFPCPDGARYVVDLANDCFREYKDAYSDFPVMLLVLESPHKDEYNQSTKRAICPANGSTGTSIDRNIRNLLKKAYQQPMACRDIPAEFLLYFVEAVSYQCSNNNEPIKHEERDELFRKVWGEFGKDDFEKRIKKLSPFAVINACTGWVGNIRSYINRCNRDKGNHKNPKYMNALNVLVQMSLDSIWLDTDVDLLYSSHPSSPHFKGKGLFFRKRQRS